MSLINLRDNLSEGEIFYRWCSGRLNANKNVLTAITGPTGSGKSLNDLRRAELHYQKHFKESFPIENCCFSIAEVIKRISSGNLRKGEILILEEAGVNAGSADWQNKVVKMFNYVLQSFRSMNIILFMNLPVLTMLSKQARQLIHMHLETKGIDNEKNEIKIKPLYHQLNQHSGNSYWKFLRIRYQGRKVKVNILKYSAPSDELRRKYEIKKAKFLSDITSDFNKEIESAERDKLKKMARNDLTERQLEVFNHLQMGLSQTEIAEIQGVTLQAINGIAKAVKNKGYSIGKAKNKGNKVDCARPQLNL